MISAADTTPTEVVSPDGTGIAYWTSGDGPPLLLVHGTPADHTRWRPLLPFLEPHVTVHAMDRRGCGTSGDAMDDDIVREYEDVAEVVDAVAGLSGSSVDVYGHSMGGFVAFHAAARTSNIRRLVLYEGWPPTDPGVFAYPPGLGERLDALLAEGDREGLVATYFQELFQMSDEELQAFRAQPSWAGRVAAAHTITRSDRAFFSARFEPADAAKITVPTLLVTGADSTDSYRGDIEAVARALPDARILEIDGQTHLGDILAPEVFSAGLLAFLHRDAELGDPHV